MSLLYLHSFPSVPHSCFQCKKITEQCKDLQSSIIEMTVIYIYSYVVHYSLSVCTQAYVDHLYCKCLRTACIIPWITTPHMMDYIHTVRVATVSLCSLPLIIFPFLTLLIHPAPKHTKKKKAIKSQCMKFELWNYVKYNCTYKGASFENS